MSNRINLKIINNTGTTVRCSDTSCEAFTNLSVGTTVANKGQDTFNSDTNDRIFCTFQQEAPGKGKWQLAMTCPEMSDNSACGSLDAGLQHYSPSGSPATFTFILGEPNLADWENPTENKGETISYGDCS